MILENIQFAIPQDKVLLRLRYNVKKSEISKSVAGLIDAMMQEGYILSEPQAIVKHFAIVRNTGDEVFLEGASFILRGASLARHLAECAKVTLLLATIGDACDAQVKKYLAEKEVSKAAVLDAIASEAVEAVTEKVNEFVRQEAVAEGYETVARFSAGYGDWCIAEQPAIIAELGGDDIGVSVTSANCMLPEKSVSACIGWKKKVRVVRAILEHMSDDNGK